MRSFLTIAFVVTVLASPGSALPISPSERAKVFAVCAGHYSALVEHQRLFDGQASEASTERRDVFAMMLDAVWPDAVAYGVPEPAAMAWRVEAKAVQAALLSASVFNMVPERARPAKRVAQANIARCDALLLGA